jgi:hypothetical protein
VVIATAACGSDGQGVRASRPTTSGPPDVAGQSGVSGRVTSAAGGGPVAGAAVEVAARDPQRPSPALAGVTDGDGRYVWQLADGTWDITVSAPGFRPATTMVVVRSGAAVRADLVLEPAP